jgi:hypothetical protein
MITKYHIQEEIRWAEDEQQEWQEYLEKTEGASGA